LRMLVEEVVVALDRQPASREELRRDRAAERTDERLGRLGPGMPDEERRRRLRVTPAVVSIRRDRSPGSPGRNSRDEIGDSERLPRRLRFRLGRDLDGT